MFEIFHDAVFLKELKKAPFLKDSVKKAIRKFSENPNHPSLNVEKLEPKNRGIFSMRLNRQMRILFSWKGNRIQLHHISKHYK